MYQIRGLTRIFLDKSIQGMNRNLPFIIGLPNLHKLRDLWARDIQASASLGDSESPKSTVIEVSQAVNKATLDIIGLAGEHPRSLKNDAFQT